MDPTRNPRYEGIIAQVKVVVNSVLGFGWCWLLCGCGSFAGPRRMTNCINAGARWARSVAGGGGPGRHGRVGLWGCVVLRALSGC